MSSRTTIAKIGSREEWLAAREQLLAREKEHTRLGDEIARQRRELPRVPVEKDYRFDTDDGEKALVELFEEAVRRARLYLQAGADCVFPIRLADDALIGEFVRRVEGPVNVVGAGAPPLARLAELGVARISFAEFLMNQLYGAHEAKLSEIAAEAAAIA